MILITFSGLKINNIIRRFAAGLLLTATLFALSFNAYSQADNNVIKFRKHKNFAPYFYVKPSILNASGMIPQGYIPALLKYVVDDYQLEIRYIRAPRKRLQAMYDKKKINAAILSKKWVYDPENYIFSQPLGRYTTVLIAKSPLNSWISDNEARIGALHNESICAVRGYVYPRLTPLWKKNTLKRINFSNQLVQLKGLVAGRCSYAVINVSSFNFYKKQFPKTSFTQFATLSSVPLTVGFEKDESTLAEHFDLTISRLKSNGELGILQTIYKIEK